MSVDGVYSVIALALEYWGLCYVLGLILLMAFVFFLMRNALIFIEIEGDYV